MTKPNQKQSRVKSFIKSKASSKAKLREKTFEEVIDLEAWRNKALLEAKARHPSSQKLY